MIWLYGDFWRFSTLRQSMSRYVFRRLSAKSVSSQKGETIREAGWRAVYDSSIEEEDGEDELGNQTLPDLKEGQSLLIKRQERTEGKTKPPARYTEAALLTAMEKGGLGTVATRADIIEKLFHTFYMEKKGNDLLITSKGKQLLELVPQDLKKPELTARWEKELQRISEGKQKESSFMREIERYTNDVLSDIRTSEGTFRHDNLTNRKCPRCGKRMLAVNGRTAKCLSARTESADTERQSPGRPMPVVRSVTSGWNFLVRERHRPLSASVVTKRRWLPLKTEGREKERT